MSKADLEQLARTVEALQARVAELESQIARLQGPAAPEPARPAEEEISEEILMAISAAVAAYLGERAHVRAVRLISTSRWSQEGRVSIQASHRLERGL